MKNLKKIDVVTFIKTVQLDNILDNYRDNLLYPLHRDWFKNVICKQKERLVNNSEVINSMVVFVNDYIREAVEIAISVLLEDVLNKLSFKSNTKLLYTKKKLNPFDVVEFDRIFKQEMVAMNVANHPRLWTTLGISYGQGMERGLSDLGKSPEQLPWHEFRETKLYQQKLWGTLNHLSTGLSSRVLGVVAVGVADGLSPYTIATRLREIKLAPKQVFVQPKIVDGKVVRKEYSYLINQRRYSEMIARTESARALTEGRVDAYRRAGIKQVQWLSAGDDRVCDMCMDLDGRIFPINAAPMVPLHVDCLIEGKTNIYTIKGWEQIKKIKKGDLVLTHTGKFKHVLRVLEDKYYKGEIIKIYYGWDRNKERGFLMKHISFTPEHPILTTNGWKLVKNINKNDKIKFLAKKCLNCNKLFPIFSGEEKRFCCVKCGNSYTAKIQWKNPKNRKIVSKKVSKWNFKRYKENPELKFILTKQANKKIRQLIKEGKFAGQLNKGKTYEEIHGIKKAKEIKKKISTSTKKSEYHISGTWIKGLTKETSAMIRKNILKTKKYFQEHPERHPNAILAKKGCISEPQKELFRMIKKVYKDAVLNYPLRTKKSVRFLDVGIPSLKLDCEYDGYYWHKDSKVNDKKREREISKVGWATIRFTKTDYKDCIKAIKRLEKNHNGLYEFMELPIIKIEKKILKTKKKLFNFAVEDDNSYIVKGMVTHNCRCDKVSAGLTEPVKIPSSNDGERLYANSLTKDYTKNVDALKSDLVTFKTNYSGLTTIQRKQFLRQTLNQYNSVGIVPKVAHSSLDDIGMMVLQSKKLEMLSARQKAFLKLGNGNKKTYLILNSSKINYLNPNIKISELRSIVTRRMPQLDTLGVNMSYGNSSSLDRYNVVYLMDFKKLYKLPMGVGEVVSGKTLIHELTHSISVNIGDSFWKKKFGGYTIEGLYAEAKQGHICYSYSAGMNPFEYFSDLVAGKYSNLYKIHANDTKYLSELENYLLLGK